MVPGRTHRDRADAGGRRARPRRVHRPERPDRLLAQRRRDLRFVVDLDDERRRHRSAAADDGRRLARCRRTSPDGTRLAFATNRDGDFEVYVMNADGTDQKRLTNTAGAGRAADLVARWHADRVRQRARLAVGRLLRQIYVMNADGTNQHSVSTGGHDDLARPGTERCPDRLLQRRGGGRGAEAALRRSHRCPRPPPDLHRPNGLVPGSESFAPDGSRIAFWSPPAGGPGGDLTVVPYGSDVQRRTTNGSDWTEPPSRSLTGSSSLSSATAPGGRRSS